MGKNAPSGAQQTTKSLASLELDAAEAQRWLERISYSLMNIFLAQEKFGLALEICQQMQKDFAATNGGAKHSPELCTLEVRIYLQVGNLDEAAAVHEELELREPKESRWVSFSKGLLDFAKCEYKEAISCFETVIRLDGEKAALGGTDGDDEGGSCWRDTKNGVGIVAASNNLAICALYCCALKRAVSCLEVSRFFRCCILHRPKDEPPPRARALALPLHP